MTMPILILIYAAAAVVLLGIFAGIPMWITRRKPDTAPDHNLPRYLRAEWDSISERIPADAGHRPGRKARLTESNISMRLRP